MATFRAPAGDGEVLAVPDFAEVPRLVAENRRRLARPDVVVGGLPLPELRALARREALNLADGGRTATVRERVFGGGHPLPDGRGSPAPLLLAGHQPELSHPGVWVKNFALNGLAKKVGGVPLHLVADTDTLKTASLRLPVVRGPKAHLEAVPFDTFAGEEPFETRRVIDADLFRSFPDRVAPRSAGWGYRPLLPDAWRGGGRTVGEAFTAMRRDRERAWDCDNLELSVSRLSQTEAFARFAFHILGNLRRFREAYNAAVRAYRNANGIDSKNHPAPDLADGEAPFWVRTAAGRRERATAASDLRSLRPRALTLTLFARVCLGDFFVHGIGGGKYDEVTDAIVRDYFGLEPPAYQVLSATLHLPLPAFPSTPDDLTRAERRVRDLHWNPQRHLPPEIAARKAALVASEPPVTDRAARRAWFRELRRVTEELRPLAADQVPSAEAERERVRAEVAANAVLRRRDYAWVLYPEAALRPFLRRFLDV
ncbi:MAG: hypothetical protein C0501_04080 [Isosphaera sp.]|nr:hypothetical protein [Isosphaera sp.]